MTKDKAYELTTFFIQIEIDMAIKGRKNISEFAKRQRQRYWKIANLKGGD
ncbi:hypothetical protein ACFFJQ_06825 [Bacillus capparidis]|uniref:Uncharacterized protein n=1 Tax=Bacillus capparidis TaxID=1840411 RepID=A0ABS4D1K5_9BACI|nr:hypothetical protein [Bacillus capparidis]MBP1083478.1 hypothetical protein [Bacillus capparidis]MED1094680.1 hypothetical protein [Bacillus capparidis]